MSGNFTIHIYQPFINTHINSSITDNLPSKHKTFVWATVISVIRPDKETQMEEDIEHE